MLTFVFSPTAIAVHDESNVAWNFLKVKVF
jgi:hypothetical protein